MRRPTRAISRGATPASPVRDGQMTVAAPMMSATTSMRAMTAHVTLDRATCRIQVTSEPPRTIERRRHGRTQLACRRVPEARRFRYRRAEVKSWGDAAVGGYGVARGGGWSSPVCSVSAPACVARRSGDGQRRGTWASVRRTDPDLAAPSTPVDRTLTADQATLAAADHLCGHAGRTLTRRELGWPTGFEPVTFGATIRCSAVELRPPRSRLSWRSA